MENMMQTILEVLPIPKRSWREARYEKMPFENSSDEISTDNGIILWGKASKNAKERERACQSERQSSKQLLMLMIAEYQAQ